MMVNVRLLRACRPIPLMLVNKGRTHQVCPSEEQRLVRLILLHTIRVLVPVQAAAVLQNCRTIMTVGQIVSVIENYLEKCRRNER